MGAYIIGEHPVLKRTLQMAARAAAVNRSVLVRGERGTGKELAARYIHDTSPRREKPFIVINCGAFGGDLLRSELFGHEKGAFTGATEQRKGKLELASGGTLFLDEIGNMSMEFQEKILRVIEYQQFERTGGSQTVHADVRIVAATNADLATMMNEQNFRADLYDRLTFAELTMPPLRERRSDIPLLIQFFAQKLAGEMPSMEWRKFHPATVDSLMRYHWPGNIRQLKNVVERLYILSDSGEEILPGELPPELSPTPAAGGNFDEKVEAYQLGLLLNAVRTCDSNQKAAAESLGLTYDRFRHIARKVGLKDFI